MEQADPTRVIAGSGMPEPKGRTLALSAPRRFIADMVHYARRIPTIPVARVVDASGLRRARAASALRPSWSVLFMKAYGLVAAEHPTLRRAMLTFPWSRLYEHPQSVCALAIERVYAGEEGIFIGLFRAPERQSLAELQAALEFYKTQPLEEVGFFRQELRICSAPWFARRFLWWSTLHVDGLKRAKRLGTFGMTTYGALGAEQIHPISPLSTTLTFGPIDADGRVCVKLVYDHRVMDGAFVARRLADLEEVLRGAICDELRAGIRAASPAA